MKNNIIKLLSVLLPLLLLCGCTAAPTVPAELTEPPAATDVSSTEVPADDPESAADYIFPLCETEMFRLDLLLYKTPEGQSCCTLRAIPSTEESISLNCSSVLMNGTVSAAAIHFYLFNGNPDSAEVASYTLLGQPLQTFSCTVDAEGYDSDFEFSQNCSISVPPTFSPHLICERIYDAKADCQTLFEDERVKLTLLTAGNLFRNDQITPSFSIAMLTENKTDTPMPLRVSSAAVNGFMIDLYGANTTVPAKHQLYSVFDLSSIALSDAGIDTISELSLQILTDESENTGMAFHADGGSWYSVVLQQSGTVKSVEIREILYEDDTLQIGLLGLNTKDYSLDNKICYEWQLSILNKSDQNLTLSSINETTDGKADESVASLYGNLGAGTRMNENVWVYAAPGAPVPEVAFCLKVTSQGSGSLLYTIDTPIVLPTE